MSSAPLDAGPSSTTLLASIEALPTTWHGSGTVSSAVLRALERHGGRPRRSIETGTGKTTLLLSHLSSAHTVFTKDDAGDGDSLEAVRKSPLLNAGRVEFVLGPTQRTLLAQTFPEPLDLAFLDGPHAYPFPDLEYWAIYPHLGERGLLVIDDIHIRTIANLFRVLRADAMWSLLEVVDNTAFFRRTGAPQIDPFGEGWWLQGYNAKRELSHLPLLERVKQQPRALGSNLKRRRQLRRQG